tara:strand:+ start:136 stop:732 length:597 start_codon:yes stop_codon:yes gene_type:complete
MILTFINCKSQSNPNSNSEKYVELNAAELSIELNESQLKNTKSSPFTSSKSMAKELEIQLLFRKKYFSVINEIRTEYPNRPLIISESYPFECSGCPANYVNFFNNKILITLRLEDFQNKSIDEIEYKEKRRLTEFKNSMFDDLKIIYKNLELKTKWNSNPAEYGTDLDCSDGSNSFYSVYFPNGTIESMYMRCWTAEL